MAALPPLPGEVAKPKITLAEAVDHDTGFQRRKGRNQTQPEVVQCRQKSQARRNWSLQPVQI
jgi:hypothetical protein